MRTGPCCDLHLGADIGCAGLELQHDDRAPSDLVDRSDDWWAGFRAGVTSAHAETCSATSAERDHLREQLAAADRFAEQRIRDLQDETARSIAGLERHHSRELEAALERMRKAASS